MEDIIDLFNKWGIGQSSAKAILVLIASILVWFLILLLKRVLTRKIETSNTRYHTRKFLNFITFFLIILIVIISYSNKLGGLGVALGVAGAGIAFALQQVIVSFAGWLSILFGRLFVTGDRVQLGRVTGDVIDIGVLRTTLMETGQWVDGDIYNGRIVSISNSIVFQDPVFNYSGDFPFVWDEFKISLLFSSDHKLAKETFHKIATEVTGEFAKTSQEHWETLFSKYMVENVKTDPLVTMALTSQWVEYTVRYIVDYRRRRTIKDLMFEKIYDAVNNSKGALAFSSSGKKVVYVQPAENIS